MRKRGEEGQKVAHFLVQCLFCMFAEDEQLLPGGIFTDLLKNAGSDADKAARRIEKLFTAMQKKGGDYGDHDIAWFNGGLFKNIDVPPLTVPDLDALHSAAADMDWRAIDPTIFGTLFERGLDPAARAPLGAHYTDTGTIAKLIEPLVSEPLAAEWAKVRPQLAAGNGHGPKSKEGKAARAAYQSFLLRLNHFRVLDPACGSGNFLYLALKALRDIEKRAHVDAQELGLGAELSMQTGPHNILGLEINEFAAELARVTVWIGDIQWCRRNGYPHAINPILKPLDGIEHRDALLNPDGSETDWPTADVIVGNPPFLGGSRKSGELGREYFDALNRVYDKHVPGGADLVCYWFHKARKQIVAGQLKAAGLVATQGIRTGSNRKVLDTIVDVTNIFEAWSDEEWINEGAGVRVSLVGFGPLFGVDRANRLNGNAVSKIHADLTAHPGLDLTQVRALGENTDTSFEGTKKYGDFDIPGEIARQWLSLPNPNGLSNSQIIKPWANGNDIAKRPSDTWIIDFGTDVTEPDASLFESPFQHILAFVKGKRNDKKWWLHERPRPEMRKAMIGLSRYIATIRVAKHRFFVWKDASCLPDTRLCVIARADDLTIGILSSRPHEIWALANASIHGDGTEGGRPTYNGKSCFETFPFPAGLTPRDTAAGAPSGPHAEAIATAARRLNELREAWLNPAEWVDWLITPEEEKAGFPKRPVAKPGHEADLKKRTLTNLYNARPAWLDLAHKALDQAVAAAYNWPDYTPEMPDEEILLRLLALNLERAGQP